jgi:hypothetical protein
MGVLTDLEKLHAAEDFFTYLKVPYEASLLSVARLHILKRMGTYLAAEDFSSAAEEEILAGARETLVRAYADFTASSPMTERVFKVLQEHDPALGATKDQPAKPFVPLDMLTIVGQE